MLTTKLVNLVSILTLVMGIPTFASIAQANPHHGYGRIAADGMGRQTDLQLTPEQQAKKERLRQSARTQIEAILTPEQRQKYQQIEAQYQDKSARKDRLNLTAEQKTQLQAIRKANRAQFLSVLTPAQQTQLTQGGNRERGGWKKTQPHHRPKSKNEGT